MLSEIAKSLDVPMRPEALTVARQLKLAGVVGFKEDSDFDGLLNLTLKGIEEAERMEKPWHKRWPSEYPILFAAIISLFTALTVAFASRWMDVFFRR
jgi:hypothetical protein